MILQGIINKFGAVFIMIPDPVVGGLFCVMFGMITAFGIVQTHLNISNASSDWKTKNFQPEPILLLFLSFLGLSALQYVDLRSSRNLYIVGVSLFFPLVLCQWMQKHPGTINTGIAEVDSTLTVLLSTTILVGGFLGCFLDNFIPGFDFLTSKSIALMAAILFSL